MKHRMDREPGAVPLAKAELEPGADRFSTYLADLREDAVAMGSQLAVTDGLAALSPGFDAWGKPGPSVPLMKRVKERFDPHNILNPGRFVGGI
jgi:glycolate oxidase FAD binding subunit